MFNKTTDFITIASKGNATDAGDLIGEISGVRTCSNHTRGIFMGGYNPAGSIDDISFMTTASLGNSVDFGNLTAIRREGSCVSNQTRAVYIGGNQSWPNTGFTNVIQFITIATGGDATDFGDDLLINPRGGPIYYWKKSTERKSNNASPRVAKLISYCSTKYFGA